MHQHRHLQLHKLHEEYRRENGEEAGLVGLLANAIERRQNAKEDWDKFTAGVKSAWDDVNPFNPKTTDAATTTSSKAAATTTAAVSDDKTTKQSSPKSTASSTATTTAKASSATTSSPTTLLRASVGLPASVVLSDTTAELTQSTLAVAKETPTTSAQGTTALGSTETSETAVASSAASTSSADDSASSAAAKAGIAFGVIGGLLVVFMIVWFIWKKRRDQMDRQRLDDERFNDDKFNREFAAASANNIAPSSDGAANVHSSNTSPHLSFRPQSEFQPNIFPAGAASASAANHNDTPPAVYPKNTTDSWERPMTGNSMHPANPFGNNAERIDNNGGPGSVSPISDAGANTARPVSPIDGSNAPFVAGAAVAGAAAGAVAAGALTRKTSIRKDLPKPLDLTLPPPPMSAIPASPTGTEYTTNFGDTGHSPIATSPGAAAIVAAGGPAGTAVHRVQLDFKPTMEDELELKAGSLVRLLFEYDDGWALCIRLDRSAQGVVPRTCLSTRPLKPRAGPGSRSGPPVNPSQPGSQNGIPRMMSPPGAHNQPGIQRGPGSIERKPVPGQAY